MTALLDRRTFLGAAAAASLAPRLSGRADAETAAVGAGPPIIDTHLHCFAGPDDARFPYHPRAPYRPEQPATPHRLLELMDGAGVDFAIVVHPEPYQDDHRYLEHCLEVGGGRLKGTCLFFADRPGSVERMPALARRADIIAARIHAYAPDRLPPFGTPQLRNLWKTAAEQGLAIQLHFEPRYAPPFEPYIREFRDTPVLIDHMGRPFQATPAEHNAVVRWAEHPHTIMKLSSIPRRRDYPHRDIGPIIRELTEAWGAERMMYGGGFGAAATADSYRAYRHRLLAHLTHLSQKERAQVLGGTAARLFGFTA